MLYVLYLLILRFPSRAEILRQCEEEIAEEVTFLEVVAFRQGRETFFVEVVVRYARFAASAIAVLVQRRTHLVYPSLRVVF